jgi:hypothetical protein
VSFLEAYLYREIPKNGKSSQELEKVINPYDYRSLKAGDEEE